MKAIEKAQAIYDLTMNERCEAKVQDLFSNGLHRLMIDLIEELEELENRSCDNCKYRVLHMYYEREKATIDKCSIRKDLRFNGSCDGLKCNKWEAKDENL